VTAEQNEFYTDDIGHLCVGDMLVLGEPPAKLMKALAVVANDLHQGYADDIHIAPEKSFESCVLCSLTVCDFLSAIGIPARTLPVAAMMWATEHGEELHSLGIGVPSTKAKAVGPDRWNGHMVVATDRFLIDTTLYPTKRPAWSSLPGMITLPLVPPGTDLNGLELISGLGLADDTRPGYEFFVAWMDNPSNTSWQQGPDARPDRRAGVIERMVNSFGNWD
jgi:hypothetical protein